jgi:hypothetical protein
MKNEYRVTVREDDLQVERVTGGPLTIDAYVGYLRQKYGALYGLSVD